MSTGSSDSLDTATVADLCLETSRRSSVTREAPNLPGYQLKETLGTGAFGQVYKAVQNSTGQLVAVKVLFSVTDGFREEVRRLSQVSDHPNIVTLVDANLDFKPPYLVTPFLSGSLQEHLPESPKEVEISRVVRWFEEIARALQFIHARGILHCDLKPANILLGEDGQARLVDFGQSVVLEAGEFRLGSFWFMPWQQASLPESDSTLPEVGWDIYALGATIYLLLTGALPRASEEARQGLSQLSTGLEKVEHYRKFVRDSPLKPIRELHPGVDGDLAAIVKKCLVQDDGEGYLSAGQLLEDLRLRDRKLPVKARGSSSLYWLERFVARHRLSVVVGLLAALSLLMGFSAASYEIYSERQAREALIVQQFERGVALLRQGRSSGLVWLAKVCRQDPRPEYREALRSALGRQLCVADPRLYRLSTSTAPSPSGTKAIWSDPVQGQRQLIDLTNGLSSPLPKEIKALNLNQKDTVRYRLDGVVLDPFEGSGGPATWRLPPSDSVSPANNDASLSILVSPDLLLHARRTVRGFRVFDSQKNLKFVAEGDGFSLSAPTFSRQGDLVIGWEDGRVELFRRERQWDSSLIASDFQGEIFRFSDDGSLLAGQDRRGQLRVWSIGGEELARSQLDSQANEMAFSQDGELLACVTRDALLHGFHIPAGKMAWPPMEMEKAARWVFVQPGGRIVTMSDQVTVWEPPEVDPVLPDELEALVKEVALRTGWVYDEDARVRTLTHQEYFELRREQDG